MKFGTGAGGGERVEGKVEGWGEFTDGSSNGMREHMFVGLLRTRSAHARWGETPNRRRRGRHGEGGGGSTKAQSAADSELVIDLGQDAEFAREWSRDLGEHCIRG